MDAANESVPARLITCWLVDTRDLWPGDSIINAAGAAKAMSLISVSERKDIKGKMFVGDARMSLASALLKRLFITKALGIKWDDVRLGRRGNESHGKPCAVDQAGKLVSGIDFNISHQGGLVALIGCKTSPSSETRQTDVMVGVDIVRVNERDDYRTIRDEGFDGWVDIYEYVFSDKECWSMKYDVDYITLPDRSVFTGAEIGRHQRCLQQGQSITLTAPAGREVEFNSDVIIDSKLRRFYTFFCYKEAYIKLAGEALLAPWLKQLEFFHLRSPKRETRQPPWGEEICDVEVCMHGQPVKDVKMNVRAFEEDFMLATAVQGANDGVGVPGFTLLDLERELEMQWKKPVHDANYRSASERHGS